MANIYAVHIQHSIQFNQFILYLIPQRIGHLTTH